MSTYRDNPFRWLSNTGPGRTHKTTFTSKLHSSIRFHEGFGALTEKGIIDLFGVALIKKWKRARTVLRLAQSISKENGIANLLKEEEARATASKFYSCSSGSTRRRRTKKGFVKVITERGRKILQVKDKLHLEGRKAEATKMMRKVMEIRLKWDEMHSKRRLMSPYAECFTDHSGALNHCGKQ